jgi:hypothetical protein
MNERGQWILRSATLLTVAIALVAVGCGDDDDEARTVSRSNASAERYCELTQRLDAEGEKFFARLEKSAENPTPADFQAAERRFIETFADSLRKIETAAPDAIEDDVRILLEGQRVRAGLAPKDAVSEAEASDAEERVRAFEKRRC